MKRLSLVYIGIGLLLFTQPACNKNKTVITDPSVVTLNNCNTGIPNVSAPYICFDSVVSESRCPIGGVCIWAGYVMIKTSFHENGNTHSFRMILPYINGVNAVNDTTINGYRIVFKDLLPYPDLTKPLPSPAVPTATIEITH
jgi:hypothetical protein